MTPAPETAPPPAESPRLKEVAGFEIIAKIGQGGMGTVFKARQKSLDRMVALKILPPSIAKNTRYIERFQREARASAKLDHPNIVTGIDVGQDPATKLWYFAMEFIDGPSLKQVLKEKTCLPEPEALRIALQMAQALCAVHTAQIVHRDIKPDNILLTNRGEAKLADLGLAKDLDGDSEVTQTGQALGTPHYMAPEQVRGQVDLMDIRTDIYALGGTLFHLVTGKTPFTGENSAVILAAHLNSPVPKASAINPDVSEGCTNLIRRMMAKKREERVQTPTDLVALITKLQQGGNITGKRTAVYGAVSGSRPPVGGAVSGHRNAVSGKRPAVGEPTTGPRAAVSGNRPSKEPTTGPRAPVGGLSGHRNAVSSEKSEKASAKPKSNMPMVLGGVAAVAVLVGALLLSGSKPPVKEPEKPAPVAAAPKPPAPKPIEKPVVVEPKPLAKPVEEPKPAPAPEPAKPPEPAPQPAPPPVEPAKPPEPVKPKEPEIDIAAAKLAYARFQEDFITALTQGNVKDATDKLSKAEKDAALAPLKAELAQDRAALGWLKESDAALIEGAKKLAGVELFELRLAKGAPMKIGKKQEFQASDVTDKAINVSSKGMGIPVQIAKLHASTRRKLAELGWGETPPSFPRLALLTLLEVRLGEKDGATPATVKEYLDKGAAGGSKSEELAYVQRVLESSQNGIAELAAQAAWPELPKLAGDKQWKPLIAAVDKYKTDHGATKFAQDKQKDLEEFRRLAAAQELPLVGLAMWLKADGEMLAKDGAVAQWNDASGQQHHAIAEKPESRPVLIPNAIEGRPALHFDGIDDTLKVLNFGGEMKSYTIMWTLRPNNLKNWNQSISALGSWGQFVFHTTDQGGVYIGTSVESRIAPEDGPKAGTVEKGVWQQFAYVYDNGKAKFFKNGNLLAAKDVGAGAWGGFVVGGYDGQNTIDGDMSEILIYTRALNDDERHTVEKHLIRKAPVTQTTPAP